MFSIVVKSSDPKQDFFYWNFSFFQPSRRRVIGLRPIMTPPVNEDLHIWLAVGSLNTVQCWKNKPWLIRHFQQPLIIIILTILNTSDWPLRSRIEHIYLWLATLLNTAKALTGLVCEIGNSVLKSHFWDYLWYTSVLRRKCSAVEMKAKFAHGLSLSILKASHRCEQG